MPTYEYICPDNGQCVEVRHRISEKLETWGELCERAEVSPGETPLDAPVQRKLFGGNLVLKDSGNGLVYPKKGDPLLEKANQCCSRNECKHG